MPRLRNAERALTLVVNSSRQPYVCRTCLAHHRQFHTSPQPSVDLPFMSRIRDSLFGSKESREAERKREEKTKQRLEDLARLSEVTGGARASNLETRTDYRGREYEVAAVVDPSIDKEYVVASNWDQLESVGSKRWVKEREDRGDQYTGFVPKKRAVLSDAQWTRLLHHTAIEAIILQQAGRLDELLNPRSNLPSTTGVKLAMGENGKYSLAFGSEHKRKEITTEVLASTIRELQGEPKVLQRAEESEQAKPEEPEQPVQHQDRLKQELQRIVGPKTSSAAEIDLSSMRLHDPKLKLAILNRTLQLTANRLPDPVLSSSSTLADLHTAYKTKPKPKKIYHSDELRKLRSKEFPNVAVYDSRRTPIHKEKAVGRWKVIEDELIERGLPVTGSRWVGGKVRVGA